ncbi:ATP-binding cassette domain-containing protein [Pseudoalteromonas sp. ZZD1]|uniref:ATP-binding cassette domain-containing protein n=1 Tax=Pseudoalteromonas sp. ZZD1 TaxID=3139395 RepID=UPI003BAB3FFF
MQSLHIHNLSYQHADGHVQFEQLNFAVSEKLTAIIGANGTGKSLLAQILAKRLTATTGNVEFNGSVLLVSQQQLTTQHLEASSDSIAHQLGIAQKLAALARIEQGSCLEADFNLVNDDWLCAQYYQQQLLTLAIDVPLTQRVGSLSGGQQRRLTLYCALQAAPDLLILDEPTNHLDHAAKQWLIAQLHAFQGHIIVVSHDLKLLNQCNAIIELNNQGVTYETGNYQHYCEQKALQQNALAKRINHLAKEQKKQQLQMQQNREKAQQRAAQGNKNRKTCSQAKVLLDFNKNSAQVSKGASERLASAKLESLAKKQQTLKQQLPDNVEPKLKFSQPTSNKRLLFIDKLCLPYGSSENPVTLQINSGDKLHIAGPNGSGKSTLLGMISESTKSPVSAAIQLNSKVLYVDQHCSFLTATDSLVKALEVHCELKLQTIRHLLANIGFKDDDIYRRINQLSGGQKMQLAMLIAGHNAGQYLLLLDEPDNHLDLDNKQLLAQSFAHFSGSFILVSHDEEFIKQSQITDTFILS